MEVTRGSRFRIHKSSFVGTDTWSLHAPASVPHPQSGAVVTGTRWPQSPEHLLSVSQQEMTTNPSPILQPPPAPQPGRNSVAVPPAAVPPRPRPTSPATKARGSHGAGMRVWAVARPWAVWPPEGAAGQLVAGERAVCDLDSGSPLSGVC